MLGAIAPLEGKGPQDLKINGLLARIKSESINEVIIATDADTEGCVLIGYTKSVDFIGNSRSAFNSFFNRLKSGLNKGKVFLTISGQIIGA